MQERSRIRKGARSLAFSSLVISSLALPSCDAFTVGGGGGGISVDTGYESLVAQVLETSPRDPRRRSKFPLSATQLEAATAAALDSPILKWDEDIPVTNQNQADEETKIGILLLNLGGPETGDDVEGAYHNVFVF